MIRKRRSNSLSPFVIIIISIGFLLILIGSFNFLFSPSYKPKKVVAAFYTHEQRGNFSNSWELLHPLMKERWSKTEFMTDRLHVFVGHFGTDTFQFSIGESRKIKDWKMTEEATPVDEAYKFNVIQTYRGKYGKFSFVQEVYVVKEEDEWKILWDYN